MELYKEVVCQSVDYTTTMMIWWWRKCWPCWCWRKRSVEGAKKVHEDHEEYDGGEDNDEKEKKPCWRCKEGGAQVSNIMVVKIIMKKKRSLVKSAKKVFRWVIWRGGGSGTRQGTLQTSNCPLPSWLNYLKLLQVAMHLALCSTTYISLLSSRSTTRDF